jgi:nucleotide-binding universal stress UspA family protein
MFKSILIPISSEFYQKEVFETGAFLAEKFGSTISLLYIIEEKTLDQADKLSDTYRTHYEIEETKRETIRRYVRTADKIIFVDASLFFKSRDVPFVEKIVRGEFSTVIKDEIDKKRYDLILMGFEKECLLNYRLFDEVRVPIWIESGYDNKSILAVCSNLAPNKKVPDISVNLSKALNWTLNMLYVVDVQDAVEVDEKGRRSGRKSQEELIVKGERFVSNMQKKGINTRLVRGSLERETFKAAKDVGAKLVILGREQKRRGILRMPAKNIKRKMAEKRKYSLLFIN